MERKEELIEELADKYNLPAAQVKKAVNSQFKFVKDKIGSGKFPSVRLPYFGLFHANESRIKHLNKSNNNDE